MNLTRHFEGAAFINDNATLVAYHGLLSFKISSADRIAGSYIFKLYKSNDTATYISHILSRTDQFYVMHKINTGENPRHVEYDFWGANPCTDELEALRWFQTAVARAAMAAREPKMKNSPFGANARVELVGDEHTVPDHFARIMRGLTPPPVYQPAAELRRPVLVR